MANMVVVDGKWVLTQEIAAAGTLKRTLQTEGKRVDKNIEIDIQTPAGALSAGAGTATASSNKNILVQESSAPATGAYITVTAKGKVTVGTAGFLDQGTELESNTDTKYFSIQNAQFSVSGRDVFATQDGFVGADSQNPIAQVAIGAQTITGGGLTAGAGTASMESAGYYDGTSYDTTDKVALVTTEASGYYKLISKGKGTVNSAAVTKQVTTAGYFAEDASPVTEIAADSLESNEAAVNYYVLKSTLSASSVTPSTVAQTVTIGAGYYPTARTVTIAAMALATISTSIANTGVSTYFNAGTSASHDVSLTPQFSNTAGYLDAHTNQNEGGVEYLTIKTTSVTEGTTTVSGSTATRGVASWGTGWITADSIGAAHFTNVAESGVNYVDISDTTDAPVLVSGSYLFIKAGYVDNLKISLAKLVPDGASAQLSSDKILQGYSAYNNDGQLIAGSIETYDGSYTIDD